MFTYPPEHTHRIAPFERVGRPSPGDARDAAFKGKAVTERKALPFIVIVKRAS
jgi:hypothetical protein